MTDRRRGLLFTACIFGAGFLFCSMALLESYSINERLFYDRMAAVAAAFSGEEEKLMQALKDPRRYDSGAGRQALARYGYEGELPGGQSVRTCFTVSFVAAGLFAAAFFLYFSGERNRLKRRTQALTEYLRQMEEGDDTLFPEKRQDLFSNLEDEICKTVQALRESRENLRREKQRLADNLADISHQFKTPLTSLGVLSELLLRHVEGSADEALVRQMEGQTDRLAELTSVLLTLSRADAGAISFVIRQVPVSDLIECSLESVLPLLEKKGQSARILDEGDALENLFLACDPGWTRQALENLLKNACEHGPEGTEIGIRVWDNPVFAGIAVEDMGEGLSPGELRHIFERFYRGRSIRIREKGEKGSGKGSGLTQNAGESSLVCSTGLGLSLARALIEGQNGELGAQNRKEGGARFVIKFYKNL